VNGKTVEVFGSRAGPTGNSAQDEIRIQRKDVIDAGENTVRAKNVAPFWLSGLLQSTIPSPLRGTEELKCLSETSSITCPSEY